MSRRLHCPSIPAPGQSVVLADAESAHAVRVLRARVGDEFVLLDGRGGRATGAVTDLGGKRPALQCRILSLATVPPPLLAPWVLLAPPRANLVGPMLRQITELGAHTIAPVICERSVSKPEARAVAGWESDTIEAMKQSGNPYLPRLRPPVSLREGLAGFSGLLLSGAVPAQASGSQPAWPAQVRQRLAAATGAPLTVGLVIGPEGGFSPREEALLVDAGALPMTVGPWILRVETAAVAALASLWTVSAS